ncbi:retrovirus-related pol polyprotein from transposon TNT 1-94 [Tanacetum coccineum]
MIKSSTKELFTPFENPEQAFRSLRKLSKTRSLDYLSSPEFNLIFDLEDQFKKEETEGMTETMEEYMSKTQDGYGSGIARPKIDDKAHFKLKGQFLKDLRDNTFSGSDHEDANEHIKKLLEIVDLFYISDIIQDQIMLRSFPIRLYDDFYDEEKRSYGLKDLDAYSIGTTLSNDALPQKEKDLGSFTLPCYINNICFEKTLVDLGASVSVMPFSTYTNLGLGELAHTNLTIKLADRTVKHPKGIAKNVLVGIGKFIFPVDFIILDMPEDVKVPLILGRPFLSTVHAKIDVFKRKITLRVGDDKIIFKSVKPASSLIKRVYMLSLRERMELDLEARLMGETLILNRLLDPLYGDCIELNDLNKPLELRRNQVNDLEPTIKEGEVVDQLMMDRVETRCDNKIIDRLNEYPSYCDFDRKIYINYFAVVENMDAYRDEGMGDIIVGRPFCKEACIKANQFDGMITICKGNDNMTYQMVSVRRPSEQRKWLLVEYL